MSITIKVPTQLRALTGGASQIESSAGVLAEVIDNLEVSYPGLRGKLLDDAGELRRFVNIYLGEEDIRFLSGLSTKIEDGRALTILPAIAGGL